MSITERDRLNGALSVIARYSGSDAGDGARREVLAMFDDLRVQIEATQRGRYTFLTERDTERARADAAKALADEALDGLEEASARYVELVERFDAALVERHAYKSRAEEAEARAALATHKRSAMAERLTVAERELAEATAKLRIVATGEADVWFWEGRGDEVGSLSCPVVMSADTCRDLLHGKDRLDTALGDTEALTEKVRAAEERAAGLQTRVDALDTLAGAIRTFTVEAPHGKPNGLAEAALAKLGHSLRARDFVDAEDAYGDLCHWYAADTRALRMAAELAIGGDFRSPSAGDAPAPALLTRDDVAGIVNDAFRAAKANGAAASQAADISLEAVSRETLARAVARMRAVPLKELVVAFWNAGPTELDLGEVGWTGRGLENARAALIAALTTGAAPARSGDDQ